MQRYLQSILIWAISALLPDHAHGQDELTVFPEGTRPPVFFKDNFEGNPQWPAEKYNGIFYTVIENGKFFLESESIAKTERVFFLDEQRDFSISISFMQLKGDGRTGFFLVWGKGKQNYSITAVPEEDKFKIYSPSHSDEENEWQPAPLRIPGLINTIKIEQHNQRLTFFINDTKVREAPSSPWFGNTIGFGCYGQSIFTVDDFLIHGYVSAAFENYREYLPQNLGANVNTPFTEVYPHVSLDGKTIYFNRQIAEDNPNGKDDLSDVWITESPDGENWLLRKNMGYPVNTAKPDLLVAVSSDNNNLVFIDETGLKQRRRIKKSNGQTGWSDLESLGIEFENEGITIEGCMAPSGRALLFAAKLKQNLFYDADRNNFEKDIYVSFRSEDGLWSQPVNLGPVINSSDQEAGPVLAADGRTMYFSKSGSSGSFDLFMSRRLGEGWTDWSEPIELGPHVNSFGGDTYFSIPACGEYAYFSSIREGFGDADLFRIKVRDEFKPYPVVLLKGKTLNAVTKEPIEADFIIHDLDRKENVGRGRSNPETGAFITALPYGSNYGVYASVNGFLPVRENINLQAQGDCVESVMDLLLVPVHEGATFPLKNVFFFQSKPELRPESFAELNALADFLLSSPDVFIELSGHTDNVGNQNALKKLSEDRVKAVKDYLTGKGIRSDRMQGKGYGPTRPLVKNDTEEHRSMNRRVEVRIVKK